MKTIILHGPAARNDGSYADAGSNVAIGSEPDQISAASAKPLIRGRRARQLGTRA